MGQRVREVFSEIEVLRNVGAVRGGTARERRENLAGVDALLAEGSELGQLDGNAHSAVGPRHEPEDVLLERGIALGRHLVPVVPLDFQRTGPGHHEEDDRHKDDHDLGVEVSGAGCGAGAGRAEW